MNSDSLWRYSLELYAQPGVQSACLALQDEHGLNVNLLLFAHYLNTQGKALSAGQFAELTFALVQREAALVAHRAKRREAKGSDAYQDLLAQELNLEREFQRHMVNLSLPLLRKGKVDNLKAYWQSQETQATGEPAPLSIIRQTRTRKPEAGNHR